MRRVGLGVLYVAVAYRAVAACGGSVAADEDPTPLPERSPRVDDITDMDSSVVTPPTDGGKPEAGDAGVDAARQLRVFVTSSLHTGALGGVLGADQICTMRAAGANLVGTFRAWVSTAAVNAGDRITSNGPWHLVNGTLVAETKAVLLSGNLRNPINRTEANAVPPAAEDRVWTGTLPNGNFSGLGCGNFLVANGGGRVGEAAQTDGDWTSLVGEQCQLVNRLYCFEL